MSVEIIHVISTPLMSMMTWIEVDACTGSNPTNFKKKGNIDPIITEKKTMALRETVMAMVSLVVVCAEKCTRKNPIKLKKKHMAIPIATSRNSILFLVSSVINPTAMPRMMRTAAWLPNWE